jgi:hypothetical protein
MHLAPAKQEERHPQALHQTDLVEHLTRIREVRLDNAGKRPCTCHRHYKLPIACHWRLA